MEKTIKIETNRELKYENVVSLRKKMFQDDIHGEIMKLVQLLQELDVQKKGPLITGTFHVEIVDGKQLLDMEIILPIDRKAKLPNPYIFKEVFHLVNAVYTRHIGKLERIQDTYTAILGFIEEKKLQQITIGYNVNVNGDKVGQGDEPEPIVDVYIGINPSIL